MAVELVRLDDRLIHGQVTAGWVPALDVRHIILANDEVAGDSWEQSVYRGGTPEDVDVRFLTVTDTAAAWQSGEFEDGVTLILLESPSDAVLLLNAGAPITSLNVGGLHHRENRRKVLSYVFVNDQDLACFRKLHEGSVELECRDTPNAKKQLLNAIISLAG